MKMQACRKCEFNYSVWYKTITTLTRNPTIDYIEGPFKIRLNMNIAENNLVRFISITKKKDGLFANFRVKGMKGGATFSSSISVDINQANVTAADPLEKIIEECGTIAVRMSETKLQFEGILHV